ncbi:MAG: NADP-dependent oxidoreductase [Arcicella sp.]|nr:NADP-dependent oxidoreductase [Arcicella sp.]
MKSTQILLANRPEGMVKDSDFEIVSSEIPSLEYGQILIQIHYISLDPAIRGWMNAGTTYIPGVALGSVMRAFSSGEIIESKNDDFPVGMFVEGLLGATSYAISDGKGLKILDLSKGDVPKHLGPLGMPGMTAYFGLLERGQPKAGETVFVSGAAGVVGSMVGQIAKIKGCKAIGSAGGKEKCDYLLSIGFDVVIDYKSQNIDEELKKHCPEGISVYYDNVGGEILDIALTNLARGARVIICGAMSQYNNPMDIKGPKNYMKIVSARGEMKGIIVFDFMDRYPEAISNISQWISEGKIHSREHIIEGIENFAMALRMLFEGKNFGKLLIQI